MIAATLIILATGVGASLGGTMGYQRGFETGVHTAAEMGRVNPSKMDLLSNPPPTTSEHLPNKEDGE